MGDRDNRLLLASPACNAMILRGEIIIFHARDDPGYLPEHRSQVRVSQLSEITLILIWTPNT
jgi:hypothetical protein